MLSALRCMMNVNLASHSVCLILVDCIQNLNVYIIPLSKLECAYTCIKLKS